SGLRFRHLRLPSDWWTSDTGSFVGRFQDGETTRPVAVLHSLNEGYAVFDPRSGEQKPLAVEHLEQLTPDGLALYRTFPRRPLRLLDLPVFALAGHWRSIAWLGLLMLVFTVLGGLIPQVVRYIIDQAIPDANG